MKKRINRQSAPDLAAALVFAAVIALAAFLWHFPGMKSAAPTASPFLVLRPQEVREEVITDYAGVRRVYEFDLTKAAGFRGGTLFVHLRHTAAVAEVDGTVYADTGEAETRHIGRTPGNYWLTLEIYPEDAGKTLRVTLTPVYQNVRNVEPDFLIMDRQMLLQTVVLPEEAPNLILGLVAAAMGFFLMLLALSLGLAARDRGRVFYLGAVSLVWAAKVFVVRGGAGVSADAGAVPAVSDRAARQGERPRGQAVLLFRRGRRAGTAGIAGAGHFRAA